MLADERLVEQAKCQSGKRLEQKGRSGSRADESMAAKVESALSVSGSAVHSVNSDLRERALDRSTDARCPFP